MEWKRKSTVRERRLVLREKTTDLGKETQGTRLLKWARGWDWALAETLGLEDELVGLWAGTD